MCCQYKRARGQRLSGRSFTINDHYIIFFVTAPMASNTGVIVGVVVGVVAFILLVAIVLVLIFILVIRARDKSTSYK